MNYLASLSPLQLGAVVLIVIGMIGFVYQNWGMFGDFFSRFIPGKKTTITTTAPAVAADDDTLDFQAHGRLHKRFTRLKCPEGLAACSVQLQHFYHAEGHK